MLIWVWIVGAHYVSEGNKDSKHNWNRTHTYDKEFAHIFPCLKTLHEVEFKGYD